MKTFSTSGFSAEKAREIVANAKAAGLIRTDGQPVVVSPSRSAAPARAAVAQLAQPGAPVPAAGPMRTVWVDVTPLQAAEWLRNNFVNRPMTEDTIQAYARDMAAGIWVPTHQGIAFNDVNALIDGQHRLSAIIRCGLTIRMMVTYGLPAKIKDREMTTMDAVDRGRPRSVADQLKIQHGMVHGAIIAAICASLGGLCFGERTRRLSVGQTLEIYREFEMSIDWLISRRAKEHGLRAAGVLAGFALAMNAPAKVAEIQHIQALYDKLLSTDELRQGSPIQVLRNFLRSPDARLLTRGTDRGVAELVCQALHLEIAGAEIEQLTPALDGVARFRMEQLDRVAKIAALFKLPEA